MINIVTTSSIHAKYLKSSGVSIDTRTIRNREVFFALRGENFDGHLYIDQAIKKGAKYVVIEDEKFHNPKTPTILVDNVEKALQKLARYHRSTLTIPIIGLTGSNGKTTTKELIASVLSEKYNVFATKGNLNNHLGVPLSILSIRNDHELAIIEMGANHPNEIKFLSEISMPDYGIITNIGKAHLEGFGDLEGVRKAKTELYDYIRKVNGTIFYNTNDEYLLKSIKNSDNTVKYDPIALNIVKTFPTLEISYKNQSYSTGLSGGYNATNMLTAITVGQYFNLSDTQIALGLSKYKSTNNRSEIKITQKNKLILDAYNANPSSMMVSIKNIRQIRSDKKILIIGHMLELGKESKNEHQSLINYIQQSNWDAVFLIGSEFKDLSIPTNYHFFENTNLASFFLKQNPISKRTILLKGSRGIALEKLIQLL